MELSRHTDPQVAVALEPEVLGARTMRVRREFFLLGFALVLAIAAFNLTYRLDREFVSEWDEALYATTASETIAGGHWVATTLDGAIDYYNTKPPLNFWLVAVSFKLFGPGLVSLRLVSVISAWLTVAVMMLWTRRALGTTVAIWTGLVLSTTFGFVHVHAGRSGNTDALFTLVLVLIAVALWAERRNIWHRAWLGPLLATAFMLRGMAVLMPLALIAGVWIATPRVARARFAHAWRPTVCAALLAIAPVTAWMVARYQIDGWAFLKLLFWYDFVERSTQVIEGHPGGVFYYLNILQKHQFDWLIAGMASALLFPWARAEMHALWSRWRRDDLARVLVVWAVVALVLPTAMQTKLPWYLNTFYPLFALLVALAVTHAIARTRATSPDWRRYALAASVLVAVGIAQTKLLSYSFQYRDLRLSDQGLMLSHADQLKGHRLYRDVFDRSGAFVARQIIGIETIYAPDTAGFVRVAEGGDFLLTKQALDDPALELVSAGGGFNLYRRGEAIARQDDVPADTPALPSAVEGVREKPQLPESAPAAPAASPSSSRSPSGSQGRDENDRSSTVRSTRLHPPPHWARRPGMILNQRPVR